MMNNGRKEDKFTHGGKSLTVAEWCAELGISAVTWYFRRAKIRRGELPAAALFTPRAKALGRRPGNLTWKGETHSRAVWCKRLNITAPTLTARRQKHMADPVGFPAERIFEYNPSSINANGRKVRARAPTAGRQPLVYEYTVNDKLYALTAAQWSEQLGLRCRDTFRNRVKRHRADPKGHPLTWVMRYGKDAPFNKRGAGGTEATATQMTQRDADALLAIVDQSLGDIAHGPPIVIGGIVRQPPSVVSAPAVQPVVIDQED